MEPKMLPLDLSPELEELLGSLAAKVGVSKSTLARQAILSYLEDLEDGLLAQEALAEGGEGIPLADMIKRYGVEEKV